MKLKALTISVAALTSLAGAAFAAPSGYAPGSTLTTGAVSNPYALSSLAYNPASAQLMLRDDENIRFGWLTTIGTGFELGDVSNFEQEINDLSDELDRDDLTLSEGEALVDRFNAILPELGREGYMKLNSGVSVPLMPVVFNVGGMKGNFFVESGAELLIGGRFIDDEVTVQMNGSTGSIQTQSSVYLKAGTGIRLGLGYAQPVWEGGEGWKSGQLIVGGKLDVHRLSLSKQVILIDDVDDLEDTIEDDYDKNEVSSTGVSLSLGAIWRADMYQLGLTLNNINEPEFDYGPVGTNCDGLSGTSQNNCFQAQAFIADGRIDGTETHKMRAYGTLDASVWLKPNLMLGTSFDIGEHEDFVGDDYQWMSVAAFYQPEFWAIPGVRVGYKQNQIGSELSSATFGFSLFRNINFDFEYGLDTTEVDGDSAPRNIAFNIGFEEHF